MMKKDPKSRLLEDMRKLGGFVITKKIKKEHWLTDTQTEYPMYI